VKHQRAGPPATLAHVCCYLTALAARTPDAPLFVCGASRRTAGEAAARVASLAAALRADVRIRPGDRIALAARGTAAAFEALLAVLAAGAVAVPLNLRWSAAEAAAATDLVGAAAVVYDAASAQLATAVLAGGAGRAGVCLDGGGRAPGALAAGELAARHARAALEPVAAPDGAAIVCFTSGTTGAAKGALLTHVAFHCQARAPPPGHPHAQPTAREQPCRGKGGRARHSVAAAPQRAVRPCAHTLASSAGAPEPGVLPAELGCRRACWAGRAAAPHKLRGRRRGVDRVV